MTQAKDTVKVGNKSKWIFGILLALIFLSVVYVAIRPANIPEGYLSPDDVQGAINVALGEAGIEAKDNLIAELQAQLANITAEIEEEVIVLAGYLIDKLPLDFPFVEATFSDREVTKLFDGKVEFDGDDYDAEEILVLEGMTIEANREDFNGKDYLIISEENIKYLYTFDDELNVSEISEKETLVFSLLGKEVEISKWDGDEIVFSQGEKYSLNAGESVVVDGKTVLVEYVIEDAVYVSIDGEGVKIKEDDVDKINGMEIKVSDITYESYAGGARRVELIIGNDIEMIAKNDDEYEEDSIWEWVITSIEDGDETNSIGLVLVEEFSSIDEDEDYKALAVGEKICLPNEYVCIQYNGLAEENVEEYRFDLYSKSNVDYVRVKGKFQSGIEDYERIYVNTITGKIYDRDLIEITEIIELGDTDSILNLILKGPAVTNHEYWIVINDFEVNLGLTKTNVGTGDENFLTNYGILIENPEDSCDDQEFTIVVPEEKLEATLSVY